MRTAQKGDLVKVHYTGKFTNNEVFDSSQGKQPLEFTLGQGQMIAGFEKGVLGMQLGENKTITIEAEEAYGPVNEALFFSVKKTDIPGDLPLDIGQTLYAQDNQGRQITVVIKEVQSDDVILDANHPMAGKNLIFDLHLVEIVK